MRVALRFDSSDRIGHGHAVRSLALGSRLIERGHEAHVLSRELPGSFDPGRIDSRIQVHTLPDSPGDRDSPWSVAEHSDAEQTNEVLASVGGVSWIVVDHYGLGEDWEQRVKEQGTRVAAIDDLARPHRCSLVIDPNVRRVSNVGSEPRVLGGPEFALLRADFVIQRHTEREPDGRVLVFLGGSDSRSATLAIAAELISACPDTPLEVIITASNPGRSELERLASTHSLLTVSVDVDDMAQRMRTASLMIGTGGSTAWERACLGLPILLVTAAANQLPIAQEIGRQRAGVVLGSIEAVSPAQIASAARRLLARPSLLERISQRASALCDGHGCDRVSAALGSPLRLTILSDEFTWFNEHVPSLIELLRSHGHEVVHIHAPEELSDGDIAMFLSCGSIVSKAQLQRHAHNIVVHGRDLPRGRDFSPGTLQVLDGCNRILVTLIDAATPGTSAPIYAQTEIHLDGQEPVDEIRAAQAAAMIELCLGFIQEYPYSLGRARARVG